MELVRYAIVDDVNGDIKSLCQSENEAVTNLTYIKGRSIVKMVGEIPEPKKMKKVALYVRKNQRGDIIVGDYMLTEEAAKEAATEMGHQLVQWPHGSVIEIEE